MTEKILNFPHIEISNASLCEQIRSLFHKKGAEALASFIDSKIKINPENSQTVIQNCIFSINESGLREQGQEIILYIIKNYLDFLPGTPLIQENLEASYIKCLLITKKKNFSIIAQEANKQLQTPEGMDLIRNLIDAISKSRSGTSDDKKTILDIINNPSEFLPKSNSTDSEKIALQEKVKTLEQEIIRLKTSMQNVIDGVDASD